MIKAIIFDYGGVLTIEGRFSCVSDSLARAHNVDPDTFYEYLREQFNKAKVNQISSEEFWRRIASFVNHPVKEVRQNVIACFGFHDDMLDLCTKLSQTYLLGIISNQVRDWLEEIIHVYGLKKIFKSIVTSYNSGHAKPDPEIYRISMKELGVSPEECIFIDDDERNIQAAQSLGMHGIVFSDKGQCVEELKRLGVKVK